MGGVRASVWWLLLSLSPLAQGQFPAVCNTPHNLAAKTCCPNDCGIRGACRNITQIVENSWKASSPAVVEILEQGPSNVAGWPLDVRYQWPLRVFQSVCECDMGWGGYDCSRCDFGYVRVGDECKKRTSAKQLFKREKFSSLGSDKQKEYISVIKAAKNERGKKEWAVVVEEPSKNSEPKEFRLQNVSTYDMLVSLHFLSAREKDNVACKNMLKGIEIDFAHDNANFLTWHRYYLLIAENELRRIASTELGITESDFALPYWDWAPTDKNFFNKDLFGEPLPGDIEYTTQVNVTGTFFDSGEWPVVCDQHYEPYKADKGASSTCEEVRELCNIQNARTKNIRLQRGVVIHDQQPTPLLEEQAFLPDANSVQMALAAEDNNDKDGFRKRLEGFVELCCGNAPQCISQDLDGAHNNLHNAVHIYIGGHMRVVPSASNDPVFLLHHANIDRIFETWLRKFSGDLPPFTSQDNGQGTRHPGHNLDDYLVPLFPLKTNADMYKTSDELGFSYDELPRLPTTSYGECSVPPFTCTKRGYPHPKSSRQGENTMRAEDAGNGKNTANVNCSPGNSICQALLLAFILALTNTIPCVSESLVRLKKFLLVLFLKFLISFILVSFYNNRYYIHKYSDM